MMSIATFVAVFSLVALRVASDSPYSDYADRFFNLFEEAAQNGDSDAIGRYILEDFKLVTPGDQYSLNKDILIRTLSLPQFSKNTRFIAYNVSGTNEVLSGNAILVGKTKMFPIEFKLEYNTQNDAGYALRQINAEDAIIALNSV